MDITTFTTTVAEFFHRPDWYQNWVLQVLVVLFLTLLVNLIQRRVLNRLLARLEKILVVGLGFALDIIRSEAEAVIFEAVDPVRTVSIIVILAWFLVRLIKQGEDGIIAQREAVGEPYDRTTLDAIAKLLRVSVTIAATLVALQTLGFSVSGVLAFGGIGGLAVGFAAKDLLANFLGGLTIYLDRPFAVGDWIRSPDRDLEGTVEHIGWRLTRIRTFDKRPLYVPNSTFSTIAVENPSRMHHRRIYETIGIRYEDAGKMAAIVSDVEQMLRSHPEIETQATLMVNFTTFAPSSLDFFIYTFTKTTDWAKYHQVKQDVLLRIIEIVETHNAEIAFPTSTVHLANSFGAGQEMPAQQLDYPVPSP